jgi:transposase
MGRKVKYIANDEGRFQCEHCSKSYESKSCLMQHNKLKHPKRVTQLRDLIHAKHKTQTKLLEVFNIFIHTCQKLQDEYVEKTSKLREETRQLVDKIIVLHGLSA